MHYCMAVRNYLLITVIVSEFFVSLSLQLKCVSEVPDCSGGAGGNEDDDIITEKRSFFKHFVVKCNIESDGLKMLFSDQKTVYVFVDKISSPCLVNRSEFIRWNW